MNEKAPERGASGASRVDYDALGANMARVMEEGGKALAAYLKPFEQGKASRDAAREWADVAKSLGRVAEYWLADPKRVAEARSTLGKACLDLWLVGAKRFAGVPAEPVAEPDRRDRRFSDPQWSANPFFDLVKQAYLVSGALAQRFVDEAEGLDERTRLKAEFYLRQIANALSPSNFVLTNPELLRETLATNAENLVRGMRMLAEDIEAGGGELRIRQTDGSGFEVGRNLATTAGKVVFQNDLMQLIQYAPTTEAVLAAPLLIVPPWINKFYVLDLTPEKSFVKWCVDEGLTLFVISWVNPDARQAKKGFEHYMREGPLAALDVIEEITGAPKVHTAGYCIGGTLLAVTLAYAAAQRARRIASATLLTAQVDFTHAGDLKVFVDEDQIESIERRMAELGYLEGKRMARAFNLLRSHELVWPYVVDTYLKGKKPLPFDLLYWNADATRMPAANHSFYLRNCYLENKLSAGKVEIAGERLDLHKVEVPVYNLATREDHIAPAASVFLGSTFFGGPVRFVLSGSGHIAGVVNPPAKGKYQYWTGERADGQSLDEWIGAAEEHPGSWWPDWLAWLRALDGTKTAAREPGGGRFQPIEDAPGAYVRVRD